MTADQTLTPSAFETVIGLEVHCQLAVASKLFSRAPNAAGGEPNTRVAPLDLGLPGVLPVVNAQALTLAIKAGLALECTIHPRAKLDRKHYFYPDLPKGYQISQYEQPVATGGQVPLGDGRFCRLVRVHIEEDAGKSMHSDLGTLVDLNRAGVALIEIVGRPELHSPADAYQFLTQLKAILQYAQISDCDMEKGSLRCDANVSLRLRGSSALGVKVEIKNLNSFRMVQRALEYEVRRQSALLAAGGAVRQETRLWNEERGETAPMRTKEAAPDYRYFPDPDLPPIHVPLELVQTLRAALPELPLARRARWRQQYALPEHDLDILLADREVADWFETVAQHCGDAKAASNWTMTEVLRWTSATGARITAFPVAPAEMAALILAVAQGQLNSPSAKRVLQHLLVHGGSTAAAIGALGLEQIRDRAALEPVVRQVLTEQSKAAADVRAGKVKALQALKGAVMQKTRGKADPALVDQLLATILREP